MARFPSEAGGPILGHLAGVTRWTLPRRGGGGGARRPRAEVRSCRRWRGLLRERVRPADGWLGLGQKRERARAGHPGDRQAVRALEPPDRSFGEHAITAVDRTRRIAGRRQAALQRTHRVLAAGLIACTRAKDRGLPRSARPTCADPRRRRPAGRAPLGTNHRVSRQRSVESVDVPGRIAPRLEITLQDSHERGTAGAAVAAAQRQHRVAEAGVGGARWCPAGPGGRGIVGCAGPVPAPSAVAGNPRASTLIASVRQAAVLDFFGRGKPPGMTCIVAESSFVDVAAPETRPVTRALIGRSHARQLPLRDATSALGGPSLVISRDRQPGRSSRDASNVDRHVA